MRNEGHFFTAAKTHSKSLCCLTRLSHSKLSYQSNRAGAKEAPQGGTTSNEILNKIEIRNPNHQISPLPVEGEG